jgi:hypothetical protein
LPGAIAFFIARLYCYPVAGLLACLRVSDTAIAITARCWGWHYFALFRFLTHAQAITMVATIGSVAILPASSSSSATSLS